MISVATIKSNNNNDNNNNIEYFWYDIKSPYCIY